MKSMVVVKKEVVIKSIVIDVPDDVENVEEYCHEQAEVNSDSDEWEMEEWSSEIVEVVEYDE